MTKRSKVQSPFMWAWCASLEHELVPLYLRGCSRPSCGRGVREGEAQGFGKNVEGAVALHVGVVCEFPREKLRRCEIGVQSPFMWAWCARAPLEAYDSKPLFGTFRHPPPASVRFALSSLKTTLLSPAKQL